MPTEILEKMIYPVVDEIALNLPDPAALRKVPEMPLFGTGAALDSLGLVSLIIAVEQKVEEETGKQLRLVNEKAMSRKNSPFRTLASLAEYVNELLKEQA